MRTTQNNTAEIDGVCNMLHNISTADNEDGISTCANCGKGEESSSVLKTCMSCKQVKYCNRECQVAHRHQHKKECKKRAKELHDIELFKQPPPAEDCPICMLPLPGLDTGSKYMLCCGQTICSGCLYAVVLRAGCGDKLCPFCRTIAIDGSWKQRFERITKRMKVNDAGAFYELGCIYSEGEFGCQQDRGKALDLWQKAGDLGFSMGYHNLGNAYYSGRGVEGDNKKARHYYELAAMAGNANARFNLGHMEEARGNYDRALKHYMLAVGDGRNDTLQAIRQFYERGVATKDDYAIALRIHQAFLFDIKSADRDKAAAAFDEYKYLE